MGDEPEVVADPLAGRDRLTGFALSNQRLAQMLGVLDSRGSEGALVSVAGAFSAVRKGLDQWWYQCDLSTSMTLNVLVEQSVETYARVITVREAPR